MRKDELGVSGVVGPYQGRIELRDIHNVGANMFEKKKKNNNKQTTDLIVEICCFLSSTVQNHEE